METPEKIANVAINDCPVCGGNHRFEIRASRIGMVLFQMTADMHNDFPRVSTYERRVECPKGDGHLVLSFQVVEMTPDQMVESGSIEAAAQ